MHEGPDAVIAVAVVSRTPLLHYHPAPTPFLRISVQDGACEIRDASAIWNTSVCHSPTAAAMKMTLGTGAATNSLDEIEIAKTIIVCGANPTDGHPVTGARIKQAARHGANLIIVDPREIELTEFATTGTRRAVGIGMAFPAKAGTVITTEFA